MGVDEKALGQRLQAARQQAGLTQQELCQRAGLSISTLAKIERGAIKAPSIFTVSAIAAVVGVPLQQLVGEPRPPAGVPAKKRSRGGVRFVYFDVNGVLIRFFHRAFAKIAEDTGVSPDQIETNFWHHNDEVCRGRLSLEQFNRIMANQFESPGFKWEDYYFASIVPIPEMHELLRWAAQHYHVGLMSNIMPGFLQRMIAEGQLPDVAYDAVVDSSEIGAIKPEPRMYEIAQQMAGVEPGEILFIDDGRTNVMAAEHAGWRVIWFDDYHPAESADRVRASLEFE